MCDFEKNLNIRGFELESKKKARCKSFTVFKGTPFAFNFKSMHFTTELNRLKYNTNKN